MAQRKAAVKRERSDPPKLKPNKGGPFPVDTLIGHLCQPQQRLRSLGFSCWPYL